MFPSTSGLWIAITLLTPFWWAVGLSILAVLGDLRPWWRPRVAHLFNRLECTHEPSRNQPAISPAVAA